MELIWDGKSKKSSTADGCSCQGSFSSIEVGEVHGLQLQHNLDTKSLNALIEGDNKIALQALLECYCNSVDLIYIDPPFDIGGELKQEIKLGADGQKPSSICVPAYRDSWGTGQHSYAQTMYERLVLCHELLRTGGALFVHCDYRTTALFRLLLDEIVGPENHVNEIIWYYKTGGVPEKLGFGKKHDTIHYYVKSKEGVTWNPQKEKSYLQHRYGFSNIEIFQDDRGPYCVVNCRDVFNIPALRGNQPERVDYPTQKPEALLERLILAASNEGDLVLDCFCGSGTTAAVAQRLKRRWIAIDAGSIAIDCTKRRMLNLAAASVVDDPSSSFKVCSVKREQNVKALAEVCSGQDSSRYFGRVADVYGIALDRSSIDMTRAWGRYRGSVACICSPFETVDEQSCRALLEANRCAADTSVVLFVWDPTLDLGNRLAVLAMLKGMSINAVRVSSSISNPSAFPGSVVTTLPVVNACVRYAESHVCQVELKGYQLDMLTGSPSVRKAFEQSAPLSLLTYWGVAINSDMGVPFSPQWQSFQTRANPGMELISSSFDMPDEIQALVRVVTVDIFGNRSELFLEQG